MYRPYAKPLWMVTRRFRVQWFLVFSTFLKSLKSLPSPFSFPTLSVSCSLPLRVERGLKGTWYGLGTDLVGRKMINPA